MKHFRKSLFILSFIFLLTQFNHTVYARRYENFTQEKQYKISQNIECYLGFSDSSIALNPKKSYSEVFHILIRLNTAGNIEAYNGSSFLAQNSAV